MNDFFIWNILFDIKFIRNNNLYFKETKIGEDVIFYFDFEKNILHYCSAGIPSFYIKRGSKMEEILMENYLIGYEPDVGFDEKALELEDIDEIIFSSDGLSELLFKDMQDTDPAKHDDVSAILVKLKRNIAK